MQAWRDKNVHDKNNLYLHCLGIFEALSLYEKSCCLPINEISSKGFLSLNHEKNKGKVVTVKTYCLFNYDSRCEQKYWWTEPTEP